MKKMIIGTTNPTFRTIFQEREVKSSLFVFLPYKIASEILN